MKLCNTSNLKAECQENCQLHYNSVEQYKKPSVDNTPNLKSSKNSDKKDNHIIFPIIFVIVFIFTVLIIYRSASN